MRVCVCVMRSFLRFVYPCFFFLQALHLWHRFSELCARMSLNPIEHTFIISISCKMYILFVILFLRGSGAVILSER